MPFDAMLFTEVEITILYGGTLCYWSMMTVNYSIEMADMIYLFYDKCENDDCSDTMYSINSILFCIYTIFSDDKVYNAWL